MRRAVPGAAVFLAYVAIAMAATWPLARDFGSRLGGAPVDPWQTLWGFWWWRHSTEFGTSPFFSQLLWWPTGTPLWFQTWDIPSAIAVWPLWEWLSPIALYNLALFVTFPLSGFAFYLLSRELWGGRVSAALAGGLYTFSTFHFAHAGMELHLASMEWSPIYFLGLVRLRRRGKTADAVLTGVALSLATMASSYHLMFCALGTAVLLVGRRRGGAPPAGRDGFPTGAWQATWRGPLTVLAVFIALTGWLLAGLAGSYWHEASLLGNHRAVDFSADLQSFVIPNPVSVWARWFPQSSHWRGNEFETTGYLGFVAIGLASVGAARVRESRRYLAIAAAGVILGLGPVLHVGGTLDMPILLPEVILEFLPPFNLSGMPTRFTWLALFGATVAAGAGLEHLCRGGRWRTGLAVVLTAVALAETWPRPLPTTSWPVPALFSTWAADPEMWAVADATAWGRPLWHQMAHRHPILSGYVTRLPARLWVDVPPGLVPFLASPIPVPPDEQPPTRDEIRRALRDRRVRYVIVDDGRTESPVSLGLDERFRGHGIVIYEIPNPF